MADHFLYLLYIQILPNVVSEIQTAGSDLYDELCTRLAI